MSAICPYFNTSSSVCNFFETYQEGYQKNEYCMSSDNWKQCGHYQQRSDGEKKSKQLRTNPQL